MIIDIEDSPDLIPAQVIVALPFGFAIRQLLPRDCGLDNAERNSGRPDRLDVQARVANIVGGGHTWSGGSQYLPKFVIGPVSRDFSASERAWQFFVDHARR